MSIVLACGDLHVRESTPGMRVEEDFFQEVIVPKLEWVVQTANENSAVIYIAGDIFDKASTRYELTNTVSSILRKAEYGVIAVPGQHDMNYHSELMIDTPYHALVEAGVIKDANGKILKHPVTMVEGAGFGVLPSEKPGADVLLTHFCIAEKEPPWFLTGAMSALSYMKAYPMYNLIISGDYHVPHVTKYKGRLLVNCGPLYRKEKTQIDFKPVVHLINTADNSCTTIPIPILAGPDVFDLAKIEKAQKIGLAQKEGEMDTTTIKKLIMGDDKAPAEFPDVVQMVCTQYAEERTIVVPVGRLNSIIQRANEQ